MKINSPNTLSSASKKESETIATNREQLANLDNRILRWSLLLIPATLVIASSLPETFLVPVVRGGLILWAMVAFVAVGTERHNQDEATNLRQKITS